MNIIHLINTFHPREGSDLVRALPVTIASMLRARQEAEAAGISVELRAAAFEHELDTVPDGFVATDPLMRDCRSVPELESFPPLPFHRDLLERLTASANDDDLLIYTNSDIGVQPDFYSKAVTYADEGHDAFTINRRTIGDHYSGVEDLEAMYLDGGIPHPGTDCWAFRRHLLDTSLLADVVVGGPMFDKMLLWILLAVSQEYKSFSNAHATFHLGDDKAWKKRGPDPLKAHNRAELCKSLTAIEAQIGPLYRCHLLWSALCTNPNSRRFNTIYDLIGFNPQRPFWQRIAGRLLSQR